MSDSSERLLLPSEVAAMFRVDHKTVNRWAASGKLAGIRLPSGHYRFREPEVLAYFDGASPTLDAMLAEAHEIADKVTFDWSNEYSGEGDVTALVYHEGACEFASADTPAKALSLALGYLKAYRKVDAS